MWLYFVHVPNCMTLVTILFVIIWLGAWFSNAVWNTHFDLVSLRDMFIWLMTQLNATHAINSIWNSPRGSMPPSDGAAKGQKPLT